jgi:hypothetical protein
VRLFTLACALAGLALAAGCSDALPESAALPAPPEIAGEGTAIEMAPFDLEEPALCEDSDPAPPAELVVAAAEAPAPPRPKGAKAAARPRVETTEPATENPVVPLDALLRTPGSPGRTPSPLDPRELGGKPVAAGTPPPGVFEEWKDRVRVERHTEPTGPAGPKQGSVSQTDAGLRIPVDESVSLEGGVRVDQRDDPKAEEPVRKSMPRVGVEVRF